MGDSHAYLLEALRAFCADELGFTVEVRELSGSVGGWCDTRRARSCSTPAWPPTRSCAR